MGAVSVLVIKPDVSSNPSILNNDRYPDKLYAVSQGLVSLPGVSCKRMCLTVRDRLIDSHADLGSGSVTCSGETCRLPKTPRSKLATYSSPRVVIGR